MADGENRRTACHKGSVLSPVLFNIYTNGQPLHNRTRSFIYADDLCITAQQPSFVEVKTTIEESLGELTQYYRSNNMSANPSYGILPEEQRGEENVKWNPGYLGVTLDRTTALTLRYSVAEYAAPVWARSAHVYKLDSELNSACRAITGWPKPTNIEELYLSGIAPPSIRRDVCARVEHSLHGKIPAERRLKSRNLQTAPPLKLLFATTRSVIKSVKVPVV